MVFLSSLEAARSAARAGDWAEAWRLVGSVAHVRSHVARLRIAFKASKSAARRHALYCLLVARCEACGAASEGKRLVFDHDHASGAYRGALCVPCNRALGMLHDDPKRVLGLASYATCRGEGNADFGDLEPGTESLEPRNEDASPFSKPVPRQGQGSV